MLDGTGPPETHDSAALALRREMTQVGGGLFAAGGFLVLFVLLVGQWSAMHKGVLTVTGTLAVAVGIGLLALARIRPLGMHVLAGLAVLGTANITATIYGAGAEGASAFGVLYVFVTVFSFYYFPLPMAVLQVCLTAVTYGAVLQGLGVADPASVWIVITGANVIIGALIGRGGQRVREALLSEREATSRLRELDELRTAFLRAVSHELRTPLTSVIGNAETLRHRRHAMDEMQVELMISRIRSNGIRLERMLTNLLDIDRISRGIIQPKLEPTDLGLLVRGIVSELRSDSHPLTCKVVGATTLPIDPSKIERVVENLVSNAIRHTPAGTAVRATVARQDDGVLIVVADDGPGVPAEMRERIFDPFEQGRGAADSPNPGTGIGLSLVAKFAQLHGGRAWVEPSTSGGAAFHVLLPDPEVAAAAPDLLSVAGSSRPE